MFSVFFRSDAERFPGAHCAALCFVHGNALACAGKFPRAAERLRSLCVRAVKQEHIGVIRFGRRSEGIEKPHVHRKADGAAGLMHPLQ